MKHALIIEDLPATRQWLAECVQSAFPGVTITVAKNVATGLAALREQSPELAVVDLGLPDGSGLELIIEAAKTDAYIVVATVFADDTHLFPALKAGAHGYVLKDQSHDGMVDLLRGIVGGQPPLSPSIARRLLSHFGPDTQAREATPLSPRELETLELVAKGYTVVKVAEALSISANTAAGYVKEIYRKLNVSSRAEMAIEAARLGLIST